MSCLQLGYRFAHVLRRMLPIALHLLAKEGAGLTGHDLFLKRVGACFHAFVEEVESATRTRWGQSNQVPPTAGWPLNRNYSAIVKEAEVRHPRQVGSTI